MKVNDALLHSLAVTKVVVAPGNKGLCGGSGSAFYEATNMTAISLPPCKAPDVGAIVGAWVGSLCTCMQLQTLLLC